ncbi:MAG: branched-chain amino acid ABC transporter permease [Actinomycetes bacterium]
MRARVVQGLLVGVIGLLAVVGLGSVALASDPNAQEILGTLRDNARQPVAGVVINVTGPQGFTGTATTAADGSWAVVVPGTGAYSVEMDVSTLPSGVPEPIRNPIETAVDPGTDRPIQFVLGERARNVETFWDRAAQLTVEGLRYGLIIALGAVGLSLIYGTTGLTNFAHGELVTFGALAAWYFESFGMPLIAAGLLAVLMSGVFGWLNDFALWKPLRKRGTGLIAMMIVSIGLSLVLRTLYLMIFSGTSRPYHDYNAQAGLVLGPVSLTPADIVTSVLAVIVLVVAGLALLKTRLGKATRAVSDNPALASASGIDVERVVQVVWIVGAALAGIAGIFLAISQQVSVTLGQQILLLIFAAVTLGGLGTAFGALVGSIVVGLFISLSTLVVPPELKNVGALILLIVVLLVKPDGLLGRRSRIG